LFNSFFPSPTQNFPFFNLWPSLVPHLTPAPQIRRVSRGQYCALYKFIYLLTYFNPLKLYSEASVTNLRLRPYGLKFNVSIIKALY